MPISWGRCLFGFITGSLVGGLIGWLIDSALTSEPYAGIRIGSFVGGLCGGVGAGGAGWKGLAIVLSMVLCSAAGAGVGLALWNPGPNNLLMFVPLGVGGIAGAFVGLTVAAVVIKRRQPVPAAKQSNDVGK